MAVEEGETGREAAGLTGAVVDKENKRTELSKAPRTLMAIHTQTDTAYTYYIYM